MPFNVMKAAAHKRHIAVKFNQEKLDITYNAGEKFHLYQQERQKVGSQFEELQLRLDRESKKEGGLSDEAYKELQAKVAEGRRSLADTVCTIIETWDLEVEEGSGGREDLVARMSEEDQERYKDVTGPGPIPIKGAWLDALPLPDEFITKIVTKIDEDFEEGTGGKAS